MTRPDAAAFPETVSAIQRLRRSWSRYRTWHHLDRAYEHAKRSGDAKLIKAIAGAMWINLEGTDDPS